MGEAPLQWHPAFCSSLQIELAGEPLEFKNEYNLTRKPLQIDVLVIKKLSTRMIQKNIGKLFRTHNIVEYKSPDDNLCVNDYYKVLGSACIYQANTEKVMEIRPDEITMSFVTNHYPRKNTKNSSQIRCIRLVWTLLSEQTEIVTKKKRRRTLCVRRSES